MAVHAFVVSNSTSADGNRSFVTEVGGVIGDGADGATNTSSWLSVSPTNVTGVLPGRSTNLTARFDAGQMPPGDYTAFIMLTSNDRFERRRTVKCQMAILPEHLGIGPSTTFSSSGVQGGPFAPGGFVFTLTNGGPAPVAWSASCTQTWLGITPRLGVVSAGGTTTVAATVNGNAPNLRPGSYTSVVAFSNNSSGAILTRNVNLTVQLRPFLSFPMDSDPGWSREGDWQFGVPMGGGGHGKDPTAGHTGGNVFGYNLLGDYPDTLPAMCLTSHPIDCSGYTNVHVSFWRWLGVEQSPFDQAAFEASSSGVTWVQVCTNDTSSVSDTEWTLQGFDISSVADQQPAVYLRWRMGPTDNTVPYPGWNIDDVSLAGVGCGSSIPQFIPGTCMVRSGQFCVMLSGVPGQRLQVWASTNLVNWFQIAIITNLLGTVEFKDLILPDRPRCFYRATVVGGGPTALRLVAANMFPDGCFGFYVISDPGNVLEIQGSTNLLSWAGIATITNTLGTIEFRDSPMTNRPSRFYRAKLVQ